jgi:hypothetical protein
MAKSVKKQTPLARLTPRSRITDRVIDHVWNSSPKEFREFLDSVPKESTACNRLHRLFYRLQIDLNFDRNAEYRYEHVGPVLLLERLPRLKAVATELVKQWRKLNW